MSIKKVIRALKTRYRKGCAPPTGYIAWHDWAQAQALHGLKQERCPRCRLWLFPQEVAQHVAHDGTACPPRPRPSDPTGTPPG